MKKTDVIDNLEVLDMKLEGLSSVLRLMSEANINSDDGFNTLNSHACDFLAEAVDDLSFNYVKTSVANLLSQNYLEEEV